MRKTVAALLITIAVIPSAVAEEYSAGAWRGRSMVNDATGNFEGCAVRRENSDGGQLTFFLYFASGAAFESPILTILVSSPSLRLIEGNTYPGEILVDGNGIGAEKEATGSADGALMFFLTYKEKFFEALSKGEVVAAVMSRERISFSLKGSAQAIEWLRTCTVNGAADQMMDRARSEATLARAGDLTAKAMAAILDGAGLTGYVLDPPNRRGGEEIKHEWTWRRVGGMQFYGPKTGGNFTETLADLIGGFRVDCPGSPAPSIEVDKFPNGLVYGRAGFYCDNGPHKARYAIIAVDDSNRVIFFVHVGLAEVAADISVADEGVFAVLGGIFE